MERGWGKMVRRKAEKGEREGGRRKGKGGGFHFGKKGDGE